MDSASIHTPAQAAGGLAAADSAFHLHPFTNQRALERDGPLVITRGEGVYVEDADGNRYIEAMSGLWCAGLGFSERRLADAASAQMRSLPFYHSFGAKVPDVCAELAAALVAQAPRPMAHVFFANSGSEANDSALKIARYYNNALGRADKKKIISRRRGYHGVTIAAASLTGLDYARLDFDLPIPGVLHAEAPYHYRLAREGEDEAAFVDRLMADLEALIAREGANTIAAFIAEPIQGAGGVIVPPQGYFARLQEVLRKHDILLIADEVICGFGRTGHWWGCDAYAITPDMVTMAKQLTAAYIPMSATLISQPIYDVVADNSQAHGTFGHGFTYSGHPVAAAVALETLRIYRDDAIVERVARVGPRLQDGLRALSNHKLVGDVRGVGLVAGVELVADKATKRAFDPKAGVGAKLVAAAQREGLIVRSLAGDTISFCPPMIISEAEIDQTVDRFAAALQATARAIEGG